jgi:hypothetical protein
MPRWAAILGAVIALSAIVFASNPPATLWGAWIVKRDLRVPGIVGLSQKEIDQIVGTRILYSKSCAQSGQAVVRSPDYASTILSEREFFDYAHASLKQLGITGTTTTKVTLTGSGEPPLRFVGNIVFLGGKLPVIEVEGVFFELQKAKSIADNFACTN